MAETKLSKARQPKEKRAAGPVEDKQRLEQEPAFRKRADRLRNAEINISPGILTILDSLPFYVMLIDERHHILLANKAVRDQLQVSPEEILGQYCPKAIHGLKGPFPGCPLEEAVAAGKGIERELYDERYGRWVNSAVYPTDLKTRDGKTVYYHMTYDITDRKQAEERHKESEQRFKAIFTSASDGIVLADAKSRKFYIGNKMMPRMDGYSACAALKKDPPDRPYSGGDADWRRPPVEQGAGYADGRRRLYHQAIRRDRAQGNYCQIHLITPPDSHPGRGAAFCPGNIFCSRSP